MTLVVGQKLGPYEILGPLGAGGMGLVYRARDTRLGRDVAVKVLPGEHSTDSQALRRFKMEARSTGFLSHPNIMAIYDVGTDEQGVPYVVSELLDGETLGSRLGRASLSTRKALEFARDIARGLAAAHEKGIVHRDLKPENIFVVRGGRVKILDFGLASWAPPGGGESDTSLPSTEPGTILGTVGYMSPEQVRGKPTDNRTDIFSFGAILFEMLAGKRAFCEASPVETMNAILTRDPTERLDTADEAPQALWRIVRHCLEKNPEERFQSASDLAFDIDALFTDSSPTNPALRPQRLSREALPRFARGLGLLAAGGLLAFGLGHGLLRGPSPAPPMFRTLTNTGHDAVPAASPDGQTIAFRSARDGRPRIWLKQVTGGAEVPLTSGPDDDPRFSPDGSTLLFARHEGAKWSLFRVPVVGGEPRKVIDDAVEGDWSPDGQKILFVHQQTRGTFINVVGIASADGRLIREVGRFPHGRFDLPRWSPDGRFIAAVDTRAGATSTVFLIDLENGAVRRLPLPEPAGQVFGIAWGESGRELLYTKTETVASGGRGNLTGRVLRQNVKSGAAKTLFSIPNVGDGLDILAPGRLLFAVDSSSQVLEEQSPIRAGTIRQITYGGSSDRQPTYSPDGQRLVFSSNRDGGLDLWEISLETGRLRRLTEGPAAAWDPAFSPDGSKLLFGSNRTGHFEIWMANADGSSPQQVSHDGLDAQNPTMTPDGWILYSSNENKPPGLWKVRSDGSKATRIVDGNVNNPEASPDGQYVLFHLPVPERGDVIRVARVADGSLVPYEIFNDFGGLAFNLQLTSIGRARWRPDGRAVVFVGLDNQQQPALFVQDFLPGRDTSASRRLLIAAGRDDHPESFGLSRDGSRIAVSRVRRYSALMLADGVEGVAPPARRAH